MKEVSKIELNAIIEQLIESSGNDAEAREILASYALSIKSDSDNVWNFLTKSSGGSFSGSTPKNGDVKIELDSEREREWKFGENSKRVGYYKISRKTKTRLFRGIQEELIVVSYFWKTDEYTQSLTEAPEAWCLSCDPQMQPRWFGQVGSSELFHLGPVSFITRKVCETWGPNVGSTHPHDLLVYGQFG